MFGRLLNRLLRRRAQPGPTCRLSEAQAREIARTAVGRDTPLHVQGVVQTPAGIEWRIGTATVGSGVLVRIADATGEVLERSSWGVR